jgi:glycosyltransferase involved in cell wall biosynthesis
MPLDAVILESGVAQLELVRNPEPLGVGPSRNLGVELAALHGSDVIMYLDADDLAHPDRTVKTAAHFDKSPNAPKLFVYSGLQGIDSIGQAVILENFRPDMRLVAEQLIKNPLSGSGQFENLISRTGFIHTTSTVSIPLDLAKRFPFPALKVSEDSYCWMQMAAFGAEFLFDESIPCKYRFRQEGGRIISRSRDFVEQKIESDTVGLLAGMQILARRDALGIPSRQACEAYVELQIQYSLANLNYLCFDPTVLLKRILANRPGEI